MAILSFQSKTKKDLLDAKQKIAEVTSDLTTAIKEINLINQAGSVMSPNQFIRKYTWQSNSINKLLVDAYGGNPHVYSVIKYISDNTAALPLLNEDDLLNKTAKQDIITYLEATGNAFILKEKAATFTGTQRLNVLNSAQVDIISDSRGDIESYGYTDKVGAVEVYEKDEIIHIRYSNLISKDISALWGMSPLVPGTSTYQASNNIHRAEAALFDNFGSTGILTNDSDTPILESERSEKQKEFELKTVGTSKFGKTMMSNHKLRYLQIGMSPTALKIVESNLTKLRTICSIYGISSLLFNDHVASTKDNLLIADKNFYVNKSIPLMEFILEKINEDLGTRMQVDKDSIEQLSKVTKEYSERLIKEVEAGIITKEQAYNLLYKDGNYTKQTEE